MKHVWRLQMLRLLLIVFCGLFAVGATAQEAVTEIDQAQYELERQLQAGIEQLRQLHSEGRYEEVIANADYLLGLDPTSHAARVWKDRAQERLQRASSGLETPAPGSLDNLPADAEATPGTADPIEEIQFTPVPLAPRRESSGLTDRFSPWVLVALGIVALIFIGIAIFAWLRVRSSQKQLSDAIAQAEAKRASQRDDVSFSDRPTNLHDAVTQVHGGGDLPPTQPSLDEDSVMQFGEVGVRDETGDDYMNSFKSRTPIEDQVTMAEELPTASQPPEFNEPAQDEVTALDFGGNDLFGAPPAQPPAEDPNELSFNSLMFANDETVLPPASKAAAPAPSANEDDALSFNSLMFSGAAETNTPDRPGVGDTSLPSEDPDAMTFNSLMFSGSDETHLPGVAREETNLPGGAADPGEMTFNSMMFGNNEETVAPPGIGSPQGGMESTHLMSGMDEGEETINIAGLSSQDDSVRMKFEQQKSAGLSALNRGDYKDAVQALSVAAGLRPDDREVAAKLAEARRKRDG